MTLLKENHYLVLISDEDTDGSFIYYMMPTELSQNDHYITLYPWIVDGVICSILPFLLLVVLNARLIWEVRKSTQYIQVEQILMVPSDQVTIFLIYQLNIKCGKSNEAKTKHAATNR